MQEASDEDPLGSAASNRTINIVVAAALMLLAAVVMISSYRLGAGWEKDLGPQSGYFPFYVSLFLFVSAAVTLLQHVRARRADGDGSFIGRSELRRVFSLLIPMTIFVVLSIYIGIYISMALFVAYFMNRQGGYSLAKALPVAVLLPILLFVIFEIWFLVPLPKGPLEAWLGY
jgi:antibiotic biosynthesis monooxygenase (ABM) superfamily enzyme